MLRSRGRHLLVFDRFLLSLRLPYTVNKAATGRPTLSLEWNGENGVSSYWSKSYALCWWHSGATYSGRHFLRIVTKSVVDWSGCEIRVSCGTSVKAHLLCNTWWGYWSKNVSNNYYLGLRFIIIFILKIVCFVLLSSLRVRILVSAVLRKSDVMLMRNFALQINCVPMAPWLRSDISLYFTAWNLKT
jgi:hypothetical protein